MHKWTTPKAFQIRVWFSVHAQLRNIFPCVWHGAELFLRGVAYDYGHTGGGVVVRFRSMVTMRLRASRLAQCLRSHCLRSFRHFAIACLASGTDVTCA